MDQASAIASKVQEELGAVLATKWPETRTGAAGWDNRPQVQRRVRRFDRSLILLKRQRKLRRFMRSCTLRIPSIERRVVRCEALSTRRRENRRKVAHGRRVWLCALNAIEAIVQARHLGFCVSQSTSRRGSVIDGMQLLEGLACRCTCRCACRPVGYEPRDECLTAR